MCGRMAYCRPIRLKVRRAIRMGSVEPLIEGVPIHCAAGGIAPRVVWLPVTYTCWREGEMLRASGKLGFTALPRVAQCGGEAKLRLIS